MDAGTGAGAGAGAGVGMGAGAGTGAGAGVTTPVPAKTELRARTIFCKDYPFVIDNNTDACYDSSYKKNVILKMG